MLVDLREKGSYFLAKIFKENLTNLTIVGTKKFIKKYYAKILIILVR